MFLGTVYETAGKGAHPPATLCPITIAPRERHPEKLSLPCHCLSAISLGHPRASSLRCLWPHIWLSGNSTPSPATGTVLQQHRHVIGPGPSSNSACITSATPTSSARRRLPTREPQRVAKEETASTDAERPREVCRACTVLDLTFPDAPDNGMHFIRPVWGGTNGDPIRTGEHDAVAFASTRSSCVLRAHPRPRLPHLRLQSLCCPCPSSLHPSPAHRAHRHRRPGAVHPPTAPDAAALTANPSMAPRSVAYSPRCCLRFCRSRPGTRCARSALDERQKKVNVPNDRERRKEIDLWRTLTFPESRFLCHHARCPIQS